MQVDGSSTTRTWAVAPAAEGQLDPEAHAAREARFSALMRAWWLDERPGWTEPDWWDVSMRDDVRGLLWLPAGPQLAQSLDVIGRVALCSGPHPDEPGVPTPTPGRRPGWPCACMVVLAAAWEACGAWAAAGAACALVDCAGPQEVVFSVPEIGLRVSDPAREELASALRTSLGSAANRIAGARDLVAHPRLVELVSSATISAWAARLVVREVEALDDDQAAEVVEHVCAQVLQRRDSGRRSWTSAEVGRAARRARLRVCPDADQEVRRRAFAGRRVQILPDRDGMATLVADLDATDAHRIHRRLSAIATGLSDPTDSRTRDQVRADVLVDLHHGAPVGRRSGSSEEEPASNGSQTRPEISVVIALSDLLGVTHHPAHVPGLGPIPADLARALAADATWRAWITDASGAVVATGTRNYVPSAALARLVRAREPVCRMPGCRQAASRCDLDHTVPFPAGSTSAANLGPLCRRHHVLKTHVGWTLDPEDPGAWRWRTPAGFTIRDHPDPPLEGEP